jgi:hypothetical protein
MTGNDIDVILAHFRVQKGMQAVHGALGSRLHGHGASGASEDALNAVTGPLDVAREEETLKSTFVRVSALCKGDGDHAVRPLEDQVAKLMQVTSVLRSLEDTMKAGEGAAGMSPAVSYLNAHGKGTGGNKRMPGLLERVSKRMRSTNMSQSSPDPAPAHDPPEMPLLPDPFVRVAGKRGRKKQPDDREKILNEARGKGKQPEI